MKNLNICIDIDGTITDAYYWLNLSNKYFNTNVSKEQVTEYSIPNVLGVEESVYAEFYENHKFQIHLEQELLPNARKLINKLSIYNNIYFVTARDKSLTMLTHGYLKKNEISYDGLYVLGSPDKVETAKQLNCDIFIEDSYDNALQLSNAGYKVLLIDTNYNRLPLNDNITRVYNWKEIYKIINKLLLQYEAM